MDKCLRLTEDLGLEKCVYFSPTPFSVGTVPKLVRHTDVGIVPNKKNIVTDRIGCSVKLLEYVYLQIPVIALRLKIFEHYFDETMIKFFEPENSENLARCISELYENPEERKSLVKNANEFTKRYNWSPQEQEYFKLVFPSY